MSDSEDDKFEDAEENHAGTSEPAVAAGKAPAAAEVAAPSRPAPPSRPPAPKAKKHTVASAGVPTVLTDIPVTAKTVAIDSFALVCDSPDAFLTEQTFKAMTDGGCVFMLHSSTGSHLRDVDKFFIDSIANLTHFKDEHLENNVPVFHVHDPAVAQTITAVNVKTQYLVKGWRAEQFTPEFIASYDYQRACQPGKPDHVADLPPCVMRFTKTIIPIVYKVTIQFDVSEVTDPEAIAKLEAAFGVRVDKAILLERTKRRIEVVDATLKCKSVLLYHNLADGSGVLIICGTTVLNTQIPSLAAKVLSNSSGMASKEAADTARLTRTYLHSVVPPL